MQYFFSIVMLLLFSACGGTAQESIINNGTKKQQIIQPNQEQFGIILVQTKLRSQPNEEATVIETLSSEMDVYAVYSDTESVWSDWATVKTKSGKLGFVRSEDIGLYTTTDRIGQVGIDNEKLDIYLAHSVGGGANFINPVVRLKNGKGSLLKSFDHYSFDFVDRDEPSTDFIQVAERDGSAEVQWDFSIIDNNLQAKCDYSIPQTLESGNQTINFKLGFDTNKNLYALRIPNNITTDADEQSFEYMVVTEKIPVYADDNFNQIKTYLNAWECAKMVKFNARKNNISKIQLKNGEKGYIQYVFDSHVMEDGEELVINDCKVLFFNREYTSVEISGKKYDIITPSAIFWESSYDMVLLFDEDENVKPIIKSNGGTSSSFSKHLIYGSTGTEGENIRATSKDNKLALYVNEWSDGETMEVHQMFYYELIQNTKGEIQAQEIPSLRKTISFPVEE